MPFYEYQCRACGHELEELQKISDPLLVECPHCGKPTLEKVISKTGFQLTGSGWYETDFKDKKPKPAAEAKDIPDAKPEKTAEKKVEKKAEKKPEKKT